MPSRATEIGIIRKCVSSWWGYLQWSCHLQILLLLLHRHKFLHNILFPNVPQRSLPKDRSQHASILPELHLLWRQKEILQSKTRMEMPSALMDFRLDGDARSQESEYMVPPPPEAWLPPLLSPSEQVQPLDYLETSLLGRPRETPSSPTYLS